mmetsp:Transcript_8635/g.18224  ORF Transcript_8635/g.18224 Transcript_8635/m.18224 type:complete len:845 (-) Transcript_8635:239-2773(-)
MPHPLFQKPQGGPQQQQQPQQPPSGPAAGYPPQTAAAVPGAKGGAVVLGPSGLIAQPHEMTPTTQQQQQQPQQLQQNQQQQQPPYSYHQTGHPAMYHHVHAGHFSSYGMPPYSYGATAAASAQVQAQMQIQAQMQAQQQQQQQQNNLGIPYRRSMPQLPPHMKMTTAGPMAAPPTATGAAATISPNPALSNTSAASLSVASTASSSALASASASAAEAGPPPTRRIRRGESGDSAEDIAVSALSMLCGVADGVAKREEAERAAAKKEAAGAAAAAAAVTTGSTGAVSQAECRGSPSFEEGKAKTTADAAAVAAATSAAAAAAAAASGSTPPTTATATATNIVVPCHVTPVSTAGSTDNADGDANSTAAQKNDGGGEAVGNKDPKQALAEAANVGGATITATTSKVPHFPSLLHDVLTRSSYAGTVLEWLPHGQGWRVLRWDEMARSVIPEHFPQFCASRGTSSGVNEGEMLASRDDEEGGDGKKAKAGGGASTDDADVNAFLWHVKAWGFQEVRDVGPDMGSYRHSLFLRGNPNLSLQMRLDNGLPMSAPSGSLVADDTTIPSLQVPSLLGSVSNPSATDNKRKIGQTVSRDSASSAGGSPSNKRGRFISLPHQPPPPHLVHTGPMGQLYVGPPPQGQSHLFMHQNQHIAAQMAMHGPPRRISDAQLLAQPPNIRQLAGPPAPPGAAPAPGAIFRGAPHGAVGGRVSMRGRSRGAASVVAAPSSAVPGPALASLQAVQTPQSKVDRRDETNPEHRAPTAYPRTNFPVSTRGRGGRGGPVRAALRNTTPGSAVAVDAMMMMKGVVPAVSVSSAPSSTTATPAASTSVEKADTISRKTVTAAKKES